MNREDPVIALLSSVDHEGIVSALKTSGYIYEKKILESSKENWASTLRVINQPNVQAVLVKLTQSAYFHLANPEYERISSDLLAAIASKKNLVFIYEDLWDSAEIGSSETHPEDETEWISKAHRHRFESLPASVRDRVNLRLKNAGLEPICYTTNAQLTVIGTQFINDLAARLLFRVYIPHGRLYATETDKLLQLFKNFLDNTGRQGITLNKVAAEQGTSFEFCGEYTAGTSLAEDFQDFSQFMTLCVSDPDKALSMLSLKPISDQQAASIITRYTKEARRLSLDLTHEREIRMLSIRHRLESELVDVLPSSARSETIRALVNQAIPDTEQLNGIIPNARHREIISNVTINVNPQIIKRVNGVVAREINGSVRLGSEAQELLGLIKQHGGDRITELTDDVYEVGDRGISEGTRTTKKQRIKSFLRGLAPGVGKMGLHLLEEYLKVKIQ